MSVTALGLAVLVLSFLGGCTVRRAQVAVQAGLTSTADGVQTAADIVAGHVPPAIPGEGVESYNARTAAFEEAAVAYDATAEALRALQAGQDAWVHSGDLPDNWPALCHDIGEALAHLLRAVEAAGVEVPGALTAAPGAAESACAIASSFLGGE